MDKFWRVLVIYIQLPCSYKFKAKTVFYREPTPRHASISDHFADYHIHILKKYAESSVTL